MHRLKPFQVILKNPYFITCDDICDQVCFFRESFYDVRATILTVVLLLMSKVFRDHSGTLFFYSSSRICLIVPLLWLITSAIIRIIFLHNFNKFLNSSCSFCDHRSTRKFIIFNHVSTFRKSFLVFQNIGIFVNISFYNNTLTFNLTRCLICEWQQFK